MGKEVESMLTVDTSSDKAQLQRQIEALEYLIKHDTSKKDRQIHKMALKQTKEALAKI